MRPLEEAHDAPLIVNRFLERVGSLFVPGKANEAATADPFRSQPVGFKEAVVDRDIILENKQRSIVLNTALPEKVMAGETSKFTGVQGEPSADFSKLLIGPVKKRMVGSFTINRLKKAEWKAERR